MKQRNNGGEEQRKRKGSSAKNKKLPIHIYQYLHGVSRTHTNTYHMDLRPERGAWVEQNPFALQPDLQFARDASLREGDI